jgi:hypothetical protein
MVYVLAQNLCVGNHAETATWVYENCMSHSEHIKQKNGGVAYHALFGLGWYVRWMS